MKGIEIYQNPKTAYRVIDGEAVVVDPVTSMLYSLSSVATLIWEMSCEKTEVDNIIGRIAEEFEVEREVAERDCLEFVRDFMDKGLLLAAEESKEN